MQRAGARIESKKPSNKWNACQAEAANFGTSSHRDHLIRIARPLGGETSCPASLSLSTRWLGSYAYTCPPSLTLLSAPLRQPRPTSRASFYTETETDYPAPRGLAVALS